MSTATPALGVIDPNRLYTYAEAGALVGVSARKIKREVEEYKRLGYVQVGTTRGRRIRGSQLLRWLDSREVNPEDETY